MDRFGGGDIEQEASFPGGTEHYADREAEAGLLEEHESAIEDVPGAPTFPVPATAPPPTIPPVGLNWGVVAQKLGVDPDLLRHDGSIILPGEYFVEAGFFIDPVTFTARSVDVGDIALRPGYFLGNVSVSSFDMELPLESTPPEAGHPVLPDQSGAVMGLFADEQQAARAKDRILRGSLGSGIVMEQGPLGVELRVERPELVGRVATVIASEAGAVVSIAGKRLVPEGEGPLATDSSLRGGLGDAPRGGTGVTSGSEGLEPTTGETEAEDGRLFRPVEDRPHH